MNVFIAVPSVVFKVLQKYCGAERHYASLSCYYYILGDFILDKGSSVVLVSYFSALPHIVSPTLYFPFQFFQLSRGFSEWLQQLCISDIPSCFPAANVQLHLLCCS